MVAVRPLVKVLASLTEVLETCIDRKQMQKIPTADG
jgi:hypothetical protein